MLGPEKRRAPQARNVKGEVARDSETTTEKNKNNKKKVKSAAAMSQWGGAGYGSGGDPYGSREPGARRKKFAAMAKSVYNAGVATASELRNQYDNTRIRGVVDMDDSSYKVSIPGSFPDVAIVTRGDEEMVIFPSYAKRHVREFRDDGSRISKYGEGDHREGALSDEEYWRNEWARMEDKKAIVDVDVRGWVYSPHRGPMTRKNRVLIGLARRLSGIPAPTQQAAGQMQNLHTGHEEREDLREQQKIAKEAEEIERRGQAEKEAAVRGGYSEPPKEDDSDGEGRISPRRSRSGIHTPASGPPSPGLTPRQTYASTELTEAELAMANANLMARLGPFLTTPLVQQPVTLFFYNDTQSQSRTVETNDAGHFSMRAGLDSVPTHVRVIANEDLSAVQEIEVTEDEGISVISDIDDTIKKSSISLGAREIFRNTFIRDLKDLTVDGVREWYGELHKMGVRFHYCSNSPWQLFPVIATFFLHAGLPQGSLHLKQYSGMLQGIFEPVAERKKGTLEKILRDFPRRKFILVGDSGEADLEVYTDLAIANPGRILAVFIRDVTTPEHAGYFDAAVNSLASRASSTTTNSRPSTDESTARRPTLPPRTLSEPPQKQQQQAGPATGTLIDFSDEPSQMDSNEAHNLEKLKESSTADLASLVVRGKKPPPPRPNKPAALKGEAAPSSAAKNNNGDELQKAGGGGPPAAPSSRKPVAAAQQQIKNALPHPLTQMQNSSEQSVSSSQASRNGSSSSVTTINKPSPSSANSTKQAPPPPPPRRRVTPLVNQSPRSRALRHSTSNPDIEKLELNNNNNSGVYSPSIEIRPPPGRTNTSSTFDSMLGPQPGGGGGTGGGQYSPVNKKLELWRRRLERAHEMLDREGVRLYTWRRGEDVVLEAVGLVKEELASAKGNKGKGEKKR